MSARADGTGRTGTRRTGRAAVLLLVLAVGAARAGPAQDSAGAPLARAARLSVSLRRDSTGRLLPPIVRGEGLLGGGGFAAVLHDGFPVRFRFRLELRRNAHSWFDALEQDASWEVVVVRDPMTGEYDLVRSEGVVEHHEGERSVERALGTPFAVDILPSRADARYYYLATLEMESLSLSELDEVERWLRGEFGAAIRERGDIGEALGHGARRLLLRLSGFPRRTLEARTGVFRP